MKVPTFAIGLCFPLFLVPVFAAQQENYDYFDENREMIQRAVPIGSGR